jgi:cytochrome c-type biogenesis protein CcmE
MSRYTFALGGLVIAAGIAFLLITSVQQTAATHMTLSLLMEELQSNEEVDNQRIQLGGSTVVEGSIEWDQYHHRPEFVITDGDRTMRVRYSGNTVLPDTFKDKSLVVLEGHYMATQELFDAKVVFAKCPSKYEGQDYEGHIEAINQQKM